MLLLLGAPLVVLIERSIRVGGGYGLDFYRALNTVGRGTTRFVEPLETVRNSIGFAAWATGIALVIGLMSAAVIASRYS